MKRLRRKALIYPEESRGDLAQTMGSILGMEAQNPDRHSYGS
jgi:hypothetical protein